MKAISECDVSIGERDGWYQNCFLMPTRTEDIDEKLDFGGQKRVTYFGPLKRDISTKYSHLSLLSHPLSNKNANVYKNLINLRLTDFWGQKRAADLGAVQEWLYIPSVYFGYLI